MAEDELPPDPRSRSERKPRAQVRPRVGEDPRAWAANEDTARAVQDLEAAAHLLELAPKSELAQRQLRGYAVAFALMLLRKSEVANQRETWAAIHDLETYNSGAFGANAPRMEKLVKFLGQPAKVACDAKCEKAWGNSTRPKVDVSARVDDFAYLSDDELGLAPADPGTTEGGDRKPLVKVVDPRQLNRWCVRECERSVLSDPGKFAEPLELPDFSQRRYNIRPHRRTT